MKNPADCQVFSLYIFVQKKQEDIYFKISATKHLYHEMDEICYTLYFAYSKGCLLILFDIFEYLEHIGFS